ncbi:copper amine oxidase N-terminal domain-containing protein [Aminipila luticellarii]|uniref:Copper amine oxidase N-terminal domain-containing protein n=1 Tax=Aminipila luticellarii TaxID=2507160 RepID=A0A410PXK5_9FIRM|nr:copper amine oxidase N-terminal domain-containing protein [Aminipila luticellarii]QAT43605.1 copper amine oxidase N-terminal domain-containing protein [Aminipila luticellarii]
MKKKSIMKILSGVLCLTMLMSVTAFAEAGNQKAADQKVNQVISVSEDEKQQEHQYITEEGTISSVEDQGDYYRVQIENDKIGMIFYMDQKAFVVDQKSGKRLEAKDLKKDMRITAILPANAVMTMSIPPQTSQAVGFIIREDSSAMDVSVYDDALVNQDNTLKLNLSEDTQIVDAKGSDKAFTAADIKNKACVVLYTISTRSIPAQTAPEMVIILDDQAEAQVPPVKEDPKYVPLRSAAEAKGYKVEWTSNQKPVVLTKNDMKIELTIGEAEFTFTHLTKDIKELDRLDKMDLSPALKDGYTVVSSSFIDALE